MARYLHYEPPPFFPPVVYTPTRDYAYRLALALLPVGLVLGALGPWLCRPALLAGLLLFQLGAWTSGLFLIVWFRVVKVIIIALATLGLLFTVGMVLGHWSPDLWGLAGGLSAAAASGLGYKEDHCFRLWEGRAVIPVYIVLAITYLSGLGWRYPLWAELWWLIAAGLQVSFTLRKSRFPLVVVNYPE